MPNATIIPFGPSLAQAAAQTRPPGALAPWDFLDRCTRCGDCAEICPRKAIRIGTDGTPVLTPSRGCDQCGLCADVCTRGAIGLTPLMRKGLAAVLAAENQERLPAWTPEQTTGPSASGQHHP